MLELHAETADPRVREAIATYFSAINSEDWERLATIFHDDAQLIAPGTPARVGGAVVATYFHDALRPYPTHHDEPTRVIYAGDVVTVEISFDGKLANGQPLAFDAVDVFDFVDGKIMHESSWYDSHTVRRLLLEASTHDAPADGKSGGLAEITGARRLQGFTSVRRGTAFRLDDGSAAWRGASPELLRDGLTARALLVDLAGVDAVSPATITAAIAQQRRAQLRPGDVLLLHTGAPDGGPTVAPDLGAWLAEQGVAAVAGDGPAPDHALGLAVGHGWALEALTADSAKRGWDGLLVSLPAASDGADAPANPVVFR